MILGRPANLWTGLVTAFLALLQVVLVTVVPGIDATAVATILGSVGVFMGVLIGFIANQPPTLNEGDRLHIATPAGKDNVTITAEIPPLEPAAPASGMQGNG